jgi:hypothetical protein
LSCRHGLAARGIGDNQTVNEKPLALAKLIAAV